MYKLRERPIKVTAKKAIYKKIGAMIAKVAKNNKLPNI